MYAGLRVFEVLLHRDGDVGANVEDIIFIFFFRCDLRFSSCFFIIVVIVCLLVLAAPFAVVLLFLVSFGDGFLDSALMFLDVFFVESELLKLLLLFHLVDFLHLLLVGLELAEIRVLLLVVIGVELLFQLSCELLVIEVFFEQSVDVRLDFVGSRDLLNLLHAVDDRILCCCLDLLDLLV